MLNDASVHLDSVILSATGNSPFSIKSHNALVKLSQDGLLSVTDDSCKSRLPDRDHYNVCARRHLS